MNSPRSESELLESGYPLDNPQFTLTSYDYLDQDDISEAETDDGDLDTSFSHHANREHYSDEDLAREEAAMEQVAILPYDTSSGEENNDGLYDVSRESTVDILNSYETSFEVDISRPNDLVSVRSTTDNRLDFDFGSPVANFYPHGYDSSKSIVADFGLLNQDVPQTTLDANEFHISPPGSIIDPHASPSSHNTAHSPSSGSDISSPGSLSSIITYYPAYLDELNYECEPPQSPGEVNYDFENPHSPGETIYDFELPHPPGEVIDAIESAHNSDEDYLNFQNNADITPAISNNSAVVPSGPKVSNTISVINNWSHQSTQTTSQDSTHSPQDDATWCQCVYHIPDYSPHKVYQDSSYCQCEFHIQGCVKHYSPTIARLSGLRRVNSSSEIILNHINQQQNSGSHSRTLYRLNNGAFGSPNYFQGNNLLPRRNQNRITKLHVTKKNY